MDGMGWLGLFVVALGLLMVLWGLTQRSRANALVGAAQNWPTAPGTVTGAEIVRGGTSRHPTFSPMVRYEFEVDGRKCIGDRLRPGYVKVGSIRAAERMLQHFPVGASVPVRYDPADTGSSLLELKTSSAPMMTAVVGALLILGGAAIVVSAMAGVYSAEKARSGGSAAAGDFGAGSAPTGGPMAAPAAQPEPATKTWRGSYRCGQGDTGLEVTLRPLGQGRLEGTLSFFPLPTNPAVPRGCYRITGQAGADGSIALRGGQWLRQPPGYSTIDLRGQMDAAAGFSGQAIGGECSQFQMSSVAAPFESCP